MIIMSSIAQDFETLEQRMVNAFADNLDSSSNSVSAYRKFQLKYFDDLAGFATDCVLWKPDEGGITDYQANGMNLLIEKKRFSMRGPHGLGKTMFAAITVLWFALTRDGQDWKVPTLASAWRQLTKYLWPEIRLWSERLNWNVIGRKSFTSDEMLTLNLKLNTGEAFAIASNNASLIEGAHAKHILYIFDESKIIPDDIWDAAEGAMSTGHCMWLAISTPGEPSGRFYDIHSRKEGYEDWTVLAVTLEMAIGAGRIDPKWAEQRRKQWGESSIVYINRVLGQFAKSSEDSTISLADIERSNNRWLERKEKGEFKRLTGLGVDIGRGGDPSVIGREYDNNAIIELEHLPTKDSMEIAGKVVGIMEAHQDIFAVIDLGYDPGVYDRVREQLREGHRAIPFVAASKIDIKDETQELGFVNLRSAAWWNMRQLLKNDLYDLPPDDKLIGDLTAPRYKIMSGGKIAVEGKDETVSFGDGIRKRLKRSTDDGDVVIQIAMKRYLRIEDDFAGLGKVENFQSRWS